MVYSKEYYKKNKASLKVSREKYRKSPKGREKTNKQSREYQRLHKKVKPMVTKMCVVPECGKKFETNKKNKKTCSEECSKKLNYINYQKWVKNNISRRREIARNSFNRIHVKDNA